MVSTKETLHLLIDSLPDEELQRIERLLQPPPLPERLDLATMIAQQGFRPREDWSSLTEEI